MGHAWAGSVFGFAVARFALGLGEAGNFPAAIKTVAEWFPKEERALATGIFNSGSNRQTWAFATGKFMTDPIWWFFLFWLPKYFSETYGLKLAGLTLPLVVIYLTADVGSIGGGWISSRLIKRGWSVNRARKTAMALCACCVLPMVFAPHTKNLWMTVALISLAAAAHQGWSANLFTLVSDTFPRRAVGSVVGLGGMAGAIGGMLAAKGVGHVLAWTKNDYSTLLTVTAFAYLTALLIIHLLVPRLEPAPIDVSPQEGAAVV